ncbi:intercellular adhesion molecule 1 isoform X2 [Ochotona curzoniae]|uniref:intercellular adhesion molecule 1 isoform X2 n=1 Tax=Ochotona curzoniae TaxID=130825 RepID=UPI001B34B848|nr:intercellular adhesion molecule 1 isoform X2 [Ochotona curzoniae]
MAPDGALPALPALLALLAALLLPGPGRAQTWVLPQEATLPRGGSVYLNCSTACPQPLKLGLETPVDKELVSEGDTWKLFKLKNVDSDNSPLCFSNCPGQEQTSAIASLTVYEFPQHVELAPLPAWQPVGEDFTLSCRVQGGEPRARLSVVLLRGQEELRRQPAPLGEPAEVMATVQAGREDHGANFTCVTELDLQPQGVGMFRNASEPRQLRTFALPQRPPHLTVSTHNLEVGLQGHVHCSLAGLFPAPEAQVRLQLGGRELDTTVTHVEDSVRATASVEVTAEEEGPQPLVCTVLLGTRQQEARTTLTVFNFPAPNLTLSQPEVSEGTEVTVQCEGHHGSTVTLDGIPAQPPSPRVQLQLNASADDHGRRFLCSVALEVDGQVFRKNQTQELRVLYGPRLDQRDCPENLTWPEDSWQTLTCQARGNPAPNVSCQHESTGSRLPIGIPQPVNLQLAGTYCCRAVSPRGEVTQIIIIHPLLPPLLVILVAVLALLGIVGTAGYVYNRQRKIKKYKLQQAQEAAAMKLTAAQPSPS